MYSLDYYLKNPVNFIFWCISKISKAVPTKLYLKIAFKASVWYRPDFKNPKTFNEKLQRLKLYDRKPEYTQMVDKYEAKKYVANIIWKQYIIPTLWIYNTFNEIDFDRLPNQFVIKCTHDSGSVIIVKDKMELDFGNTRKMIDKALRKNYYYSSREWPYKDVRPRIIIEKYMEDKNNKSMQDYKFFCFNWEPKIMYLSEWLENHATATMSFFDMDFNLTNCKRKDYKLFKYKPEKPKNFDLMKSFAKKLSKWMPHLRVDFYEIDWHLYFGELTFTTCGGFVPFEGNEWDYKLGSRIKLPIDKKE